MRILLIQPPVQDFYTTSQRLFPLGLCSLKAALKKYDPQLEVQILDCQQGGKHTIPLPKELKFLKDFYPESDHGPFAAFGPYYHFGDFYEEIILKIRRYNPDLIAISSLFSPYHREVLTLANTCKRKLAIPIVVGGAHASACPDLMLKDKSIDFVIRGEGEKPLVALIEQIRGEKKWSVVPNLVYRKEEQIIYNALEKNFLLKDLPPPDSTDFPPSIYQLRGKPLAFILSSRGCPWNCSFCSVHKVFHEGYRERDVEDILAEMHELYKKGIRVFDFEDDNLTFNKERLLQLCHGISEQFPREDIELVAMNGVSYLALDLERLEALWSAGFRELNLSLVSSNQDINKKCHRPFSLEHFKTTVMLAHRLGFAIVSYQILGLPGESLESMKETLLVLVDLPVLVGASPFYIPPESPISKQFDKLDSSDMIRSRLTALGPYPERRGEIFTFFTLIRIIDFFKGLDFPQDQITLSQLVLIEFTDERTRLGFKLFNKLFNEKKLYGKNKKGFFQRTKFEKETFTYVWNSLKQIKTQKGKTIICDQSF